MRKLDLGQTISIIANFGVIAGILFLALELRQSSEILEAEIRSIRQNIRTADYLLPLQHRDYADALIKRRRGEALTEYENLIMSRAIATTLLNYQYIFTEYQLGRIDSVPIEAWRLEFDGEIAEISLVSGYWPDLRDYWEINKHFEFEPAFVQWMDENVVSER